MEKRQLLRYLQIVRGLERDIYTADETIRVLQSKKRYPQNRANQIVRKQAYVRENPPQKVNGEGGFGSVALGAVLGLIVYFMWAMNGDYVGVISVGRFLGLGGGFFVFPIIGGLIGYKVGGKAAANRAYRNQQNAYQNAMNRSQQQQAQYDREYSQAVAQANAEYRRVLSEANAYNAYIDRQILLLNQARQRSSVALQRAYDLGHVYYKYRSLVPITMFCEYLESGRCDRLEGGHGAYNLYESELRMNRIIGEIHDVKQVMHTIGAKLDGIRNNQYLLYREMQENNRRISGISAEVSQMGEQVANMQKTMGAAASASARAADAAEVTSFHAAAAARSARAMESMVEFDLYQRHYR